MKNSKRFEKLISEKLEGISFDYKKGMTQPELCKKYKVSPDSIVKLKKLGYLPNRIIPRNRRSFTALDRRMVFNPSDEFDNINQELSYFTGIKI